MTPALLALALGSCPIVPAPEVHNIVAVELRRAVLPLDDGPAAGSAPPATTIVRVTCTDLRAAIHVQDQLTGKTVERVVDLGTAAPVARPHLLALSIVELLAASWVELQSNPRPAQPPPADPVALATPEARAAALEIVATRSPPRRAPRLVVGPIVQSSTAGTLSWGGAATLGARLGDRLGWLVDVALQHGEQTFALGRVSADSASALAALTAVAARGALALQAGLGARAGRAWLSGMPASPAVGGALRGMWWGPAAVAGASMTFARRLVIELALEAGFVALPVVAEVQGSTESVAIDGVWIRGGLGVGIAF
jgi:hypothetical protein